MTSSDLHLSDELLSLLYYAHTCIQQKVGTHCFLCSSSCCFAFSLICFSLSISSCKSCNLAASLTLCSLHWSFWKKCKASFVYCQLSLLNLKHHYHTMTMYIFPTWSSHHLFNEVNFLWNITPTQFYFLYNLNLNFPIIILIKCSYHATLHVHDDIVEL